MFSVSFVLRTRVRHLTTPHSHRAVPHHRSGSCSRGVRIRGRADAVFADVRQQRRETGRRRRCASRPRRRRASRARVTATLARRASARNPTGAPVVRAHRGHHHRLSLAALERVHARHLHPLGARRQADARRLAQPALHQPHLRGVRDCTAICSGVTPARNSPATCMVTAYASPSLTSDENDAAPNAAPPATHEGTVVGKRREEVALRRLRASAEKRAGRDAGVQQQERRGRRRGRDDARQVAQQARCDGGRRRERAGVGLARRPVRDGGVRAVLRAERAPEHAAGQKRRRGRVVLFCAFELLRVSARLCCGTETRAMTGVPSPRRRASLRPDQRRERAAGRPPARRARTARAESTPPARWLVRLRPEPAYRTPGVSECSPRPRPPWWPRPRPRVRQNLALSLGAGLAAGNRHLFLLAAQTRELRVERSARELRVSRTARLSAAPPELVPLLPTAPRRVHELAAPRAPGLVEFAPARVAHARLERALQRGVGDTLGRADAHLEETDAPPRSASARRSTRLSTARVGRRARQDTRTRSDGAADDLENHLGLARPGRALDPAHGRTLQSAARTASASARRRNPPGADHPAFRRGAHVQGELFEAQRAERRFDVCFRGIAERLGDVGAAAAPMPRHRRLSTVTNRRRFLRRRRPTTSRPPEGTPRGGEERADDARGGGFVRLVGTFRNVRSAAICLSYVVASGTRTRRTRRPPSVCSRLSERRRLASFGVVVAFDSQPSFVASRRVSTPFAGSRVEIKASASHSKTTAPRPRRSSPRRSPSPGKPRRRAFVHQDGGRGRRRTARWRAARAPPSTRRFSSLPFLPGLGRADASRRPPIIAPARPTIVPSGPSRRQTKRRRPPLSSPASELAAPPRTPTSSSGAAATSTYRAMSSWSARLDRWRHPPSSSKPARSGFGGFAFRRGFRSPRGFRPAFAAFSPFRLARAGPARRARLRLRLRESSLKRVSSRSGATSMAEALVTSPRLARSPPVRAAAPRTARAGTAAPSSAAPVSPDARSLARPPARRLRGGSRSVPRRGERPRIPRPRDRSASGGTRASRPARRTPPAHRA